MRGRARREQAEWERTLFVAYHAGLFAQADLKKAEPYDKLVRRMREGERKPTPEELIAHFRSMQAAGFDVTIGETTDG